MADLNVTNCGSIFMLSPASEAGQSWIDDNTGADAQSFGDAIAIEHRYIADIVRGAQDDGLEVE